MDSRILFYFLFFINIFFGCHKDDQTPETNPETFNYSAYTAIAFPIENGHEVSIRKYIFEKVEFNIDRSIKSAAYNIVSTVPGTAPTSHFTYSEGRLVQVKKNSERNVFIYDGDSISKVLTFRNEVKLSRTEIERDNLKRKIKTFLYTGILEKLYMTFTYNYDERGNIKYEYIEYNGYNDPSEVFYEYDSRDNLTKKTSRTVKTGASKVNIINRFQYDDRGRFTEKIKSLQDDFYKYVIHYDNECKIDYQQVYKSIGSINGQYDHIANIRYAYYYKFK